MTNNRHLPPKADRLGWDEHELSQLRYFRSLSLSEKLKAVEGMADVVRHFQYMRSQGKFKPASKARGTADPAAFPVAHEPPVQYESTGTSTTGQDEIP
ncbi:MAG: hypothetical protein ACKVQA_07430 [Burkholderiales bacterium]